MADLIDREELLCALYQDCRCMNTRFLNCVRQAPTIDAEPVRHGYWIIRGGDMWCNECGYEDVTENGEPEDYHYCPNCGCCMKEDINNG